MSGRLLDLSMVRSHHVISCRNVGVGLIKLILLDAVLFSMLNKHDDAPLTLTELSYLACSDTDKAAVREPPSIF